MSIPLDRLYQFIHKVAEKVRNNYVLIYRFTPHGSKNVANLNALQLYCGNYSLPLSRSYPQLICHDQEPLDYNMYEQYIAPDKKKNLRAKTPDNIYDKCLLLHSEQNSAEVEKYKNDCYIPVYYWAHAIIALDWFRYANYVNIAPTQDQKQFLIYNRAWAGTREYRLKFMEMLQQSNLVNNCQTSFNAIDPEQNVCYTDYKFKNKKFKPDSINNTFPTTVAPSHASADFTITDYANTKFEVVLETLFDDTRIQLTEKILRPIACGHPFLLASTAGSLKELQRYGFKTFDGIIDESYDLETDPVTRLQLIISAMKKITQWSPSEQADNWNQIKAIVAYNKQHFFSSVFFNLVINELETNLTAGFEELENTNTSRTYIEHRKKCVRLPEYIMGFTAVEEEEFLKTNTQDRIKVLTRARSYYNRFRYF